MIKIYSSWRLIEDPAGTRGWMLVTLLSDQRTALVRPGEPHDIHDKKDLASRVAYLAEPGVVGWIVLSDGSWCRIQIGNRRGYIAQAVIGGVIEAEAID